MVISILVFYAPILNPITEGDIVPCSSFKFKGHATVHKSQKQKGPLNLLRHGLWVSTSSYLLRRNQYNSD